MPYATYLEVADAWAEANARYLREVVETWLAEARWMTVRELGLIAMQRDDAEIHEQLRKLPGPLGRVEHPDEQITLRLRAIAYVPAAADVLADFADVVSLIGRRLRNASREQLVLTSADLAQELAIDPARLELLGDLVFAERWMFGSGWGEPKREWQWEIDERAYPVRNVGSVADYLRIEGERYWNIPANRSLTPANPLIDEQGLQAVVDADAEPAEPTVPVAALSVTELHPGIARECAALLTDGHFNAAVHAGAIALCDVIRGAIGERDLDGAQLVGAALGGSPPRLALADLSSQRGQREQTGWRTLGEGCVAAVRNPAAHRRAFEDRASAFEAIALMSLLARRIDAAAHAASSPR